MSIVFLDYQFLPEKEACIPISDRGFLFGDGIFTTILVKDNKPIWLQEHLAKLQREANRFNLLLPFIDPAIITELIERNGVKEGRVKILYTGGDSPKLSLPLRKGRLLITTAPLTQSKESLRVTLCLFPNFLGKSLSYLGHLYALEQARGFDDCIMLDGRGVVLETALGNLFWTIKDQFYTPDPEKLPLYFGVTIQKEIEKRKNVHYVSMKFDEIPREAKIYRTNAITGTLELVVEEPHPFYAF